MEHLLGTWTVLRQWEQPSYLCRAGLFHSCYSTDAYPNALFRLEERPVVRALIGEDGEEIVHTFCSIDRKKFLASVANLNDIPELGLSVVLFRTCESQMLPPATAAIVLLLEMANLLDQMVSADRTPGLGMSRVIALSRLACPWIRPIPRIFGGVIQELSLDAEKRARMDYLKALGLMENNPNTAQGCLDEGHAANPWVGETSIFKALLALQRHDWAAAISDAEVGTETLRKWGTCWDKRRNWHDWLNLGRWVSRTGHNATRRPQIYAPWIAETWTKLVRNPFGFIGVSPTTKRTSSRTPALTRRAIGNDSEAWQRFESYLGRFLTNSNNPAMTWYPGLTARPWHDPTSFPAVAVLQAAYPSIQTEYDQLKNETGFQPEMEPLKRTGNWNVFMLYERGKKNEANCAKCPETTRIIESIPSLRTLAGLIYFSNMAAATHIHAHKGPTNMRIRCHLGLHIPPNCGIRVQNEARTWEVGKCLVFDDSFEHEVWNRSGDTRAILIVDLWHPDLTAIEIQALEGLHRYVHFHAERLSNYWKCNESGRDTMETEKRWL
jgi:aspartyl/asparaginyl beta-hydroxylase (cupin superfamily)